MKTFGIISDTHHHGWSAFAKTESDGVNSRLRILLNETERCAAEVLKAGGDTIVHTGDLFHVRGSVAPTVLNPTLEVYKRIINCGVKIIILAGNHDLEGKNSNRVGSAITALEEIGCQVVNDVSIAVETVGAAIFIPWFNSVEELKWAIDDAKTRCVHNPEDTYLFLHAPVDGVIAGLPDHGLTAKFLGKFGFRGVFCGHYHNHKDMGHDVYSVGALAHHTWGDVGSEAGFLIVDDGKVRWFKSHAPEFIDVSDKTDPVDIAMLADGNYVRARINSSKTSDVEELREFLTNAGAKGVVILSQKDAAAVRTSTVASASAGASLDVSMSDYIKAGTYKRRADLTAYCADILNQAKAKVVS